MYAVIRTGGKQYKVSEGDVLQVEHLRLKSNATDLTPVLIVDDQGKTIFAPKDVAAYKVGVKVLGDAKGDKVTVFKYRPKSGYASKTGHRQLYSLIEITSIGRGASKAADGARAKPSARSKEAAAREGDHSEARQAAPRAESNEQAGPASEEQQGAKSGKATRQPEKGSQADNLKNDGT
jgi:large subunit ribosomal protein L21